jgi:CBS domain-containing membrane protein
LVRHRIKRSYRIAKYVVYKQTIVEPIDHLWTFLGGFLGIAIIGLIQSAQVSELDNVFLIGSFGASAVLIYGVTNSPLAQPRNLVGGHLVSALVGVTVHQLIPGPPWFTAALAVSLAIVGMQITKTLHPPGGATALIANIGSEKIKSLGFMYIISPVLSGVLILLLIALIVNNIPTHRQYPYKRIDYRRFWKRSE